MMKKFILIFFLPTFSITSQVKIATTLHPFKEIILKVVGERGEVISILKPGFSPHAYEVSPSEVKEIESADILFYGSDDLDGWVLKFDNKEQVELISLLPTDSILSVKTLSGITVGADPHFWSDPLLVKILIVHLVDILCKTDPDGCTEYKANAKLFSDELDELYQIIELELSGLKGKNVMLSHPFFAYYFHRYNFKVVGLIEPIPGKEPTAKDLKRIIDAAIRKNVGAIFIHDQLPEKPALILSESTGIGIYTLDPIGGVKGRYSYEELLLHNTEIIIDAMQ
jgi:zinc transport system substrate-binding protein